MHRSLPFTFALPLILASQAGAGIVTFEPSFVELQPGETASLDVIVTSEVLQTFHGFDFVIWHPTVPVDSFSWSLDALDAFLWFLICPGPNCGCGSFCNENFGLFAFNPFTPVGPSIRVGTLVIGAGPLGEHEIVVDATGARYADLITVRDDERLVEILVGSATVRVVPLPTTLPMVVVGIVAISRRRRPIIVPPRRYVAGRRDAGSGR